MRPLALAAALMLTALPALADWTLDGDASTIGFVTIKNGGTAKAHRFSGLSGSVSAQGTAEVSIPLDSVETFIDIRTERMREILFRVADHPAATISAALDMEALGSRAPGDRLTEEIDITVSTNGAEAAYLGAVTVTRIDDGMVAVTTARPVIADARDLGYEDGVAQLRDIAGLDAISPAVPVTFDLVFTK